MVGCRKFTLLRLTIRILAFFVGLNFCLSSSYAQDCIAAGKCAKLNGSGGSATIDQWGTCKVVTNNDANAIMVPYGSSAEWNGANGFINKAPGTVSLASCSADTVPENLQFSGLLDTDSVREDSFATTINTTVTLFFKRNSGNRNPDLYKNDIYVNPISTAGTTISVVNGDKVSIQLDCFTAPILYFANLEVRYDNSSGAIVNSMSNISYRCNASCPGC